MTQSSGTIGATFLIYIGVMLAIGWLAYRRTGDLADYILGGRKLGSWVTALSAGASDMSGWLLLGLPGYAYVAGLEAGWIALGLLVGTYFNWRMMARRLRCYTEIAGNSLTIPDFLEQRFRDQRHLLRIIAAFFILLFFLFYTSSGLVAGAKLFNAVFGWPYQWAIIAGAAAILVYTFIGGFMAVSWTDMLQGLLMALALVVVPLVAIGHANGEGGAATAIGTSHPELLDPFTSANGESLGILAIISLLGWGLGYFGQPHILARFKAIRNISALDNARRIAMVWVTVSMLGALATGMVGVAYLSQPLTGADTEKVFIVMVNTLFHPLVAGVLLAAILAAIMSTADSQLLVSASVLTDDFYRALVRPGASQRELLWVGRGAVLVIAVAATALAWDPGRKVLDLVAYAWAGFGAAFGPTLLLALFWPRMTRNGALAGMVAGGATVVVWKQFSGGLFDLYEIVPGFMLSLIAIVVMSLIDRRPAPEIAEEFNKVRQKLTTIDTE
jgi:sodium/proline symporter